MFDVLSSLVAGDTAVRYLLDPTQRSVGLQLVPSHMLDQVVPRPRSHYDHPDMNATSVGWPAHHVNPLVQLHCRGLPLPDGLSLGTMHDTPATLSLRYDTQEVQETADGLRVETSLKSPWGFSCRHVLSWQPGDQAVRIAVEFANDGSDPITLESISSFSLGGITPFHPDDAPNRLAFHRFRSGWSAEGRLSTDVLEDLNMEPSWLGIGTRIERFGQLGTKPTKRWFPLAAVEDVEAGVLWGAQLAWGGSWQIELARRDDWVALSGGLADREFGHWSKTIQPGERFALPQAAVACVQGNVDALCHRLISLQHDAADNAPSIEHDLPIICNDWATHWGEPSHGSIVAAAKRLQGTDARYLVIDAGWYGVGNWQESAGDWIPDATLFPGGLEATAQAVRECGLVPGIWFEWEVSGPRSHAFKMTDHQVKLDGSVLSVGGRHLWDMNDPWVVDYLTERVIGLLDRCGFGYLKVDYNSGLGFGCDGAESPGEGIRQQTEGIQRFFGRIREQLPHLVIENCSSGGQRLEPSYQALSSMGSFSDAHETADIPIIAANLQRLVLPRQNQVWAVLRKADDARRIVYSMAATFLGRMCVSGDIADLTAEQWHRMQEAQSLYREVWPIIKSGSSRRFGEGLRNYKHPEGWQAILRVADDGQSALAVVHRMGGVQDDPISIPLPEQGAWQLRALYAAGDDGVEDKDDHLAVSLRQEFSGAVVHLERHEGIGPSRGRRR